MAKTRRKRKAVAGEGTGVADRGFYSRALDEAEQVDFDLAQDIEGIDDEIALLRVKIKDLLENDPENLRLIMQATNTLARLLRTRYNLEKHESKNVKDAIAKVLTELAIPLGIGAAKKAAGL